MIRGQFDKIRQLAEEQAKKLKGELKALVKEQFEDQDKTCEEVPPTPFPPLGNHHLYRHLKPRDRAIYILGNVTATCHYEELSSMFNLSESRIAQICANESQ